MEINIKCTAQDLAENRDRMGFSQQDFGDLIGKSRQMVGLMERGVYPVPRTTALAVFFVLISLGYTIPSDQVRIISLESVPSNVASKVIP